MRTRKEIRAILNELVHSWLSYTMEEGYGAPLSVEYDEPSASLGGFLIQNRPHVVALMFARIDDETEWGIGISTCSKEDKWITGLGDRLAIDKAVDQMVDGFRGQPAQITGSPQVLVLARLFRHLVTSKEDFVLERKGSVYDSTG